MFQNIKSVISRHYGKIIAAIIIVVLIFLMVAGGKKRKADAIEYYTVTQRDIAEQVVIAGRIRTQDRAELSFNRGGRVEAVLVTEGQMVKSGTRLARISMGQQYADLKSAQASLDIAKADVANAGVDLDNVRQEQETLVSNAYRSLLNNDLQAYNNDAGDDSRAPIISGTYKGDSEGSYDLDMYGSGANSGYSYTLSGLGSGTHSAFVDLPGLLGNQGLYIQFDEESNYSSETWTVPIPNTRSATYTTVLNTYTSVVAAAERAIESAENAIGMSQTNQLSRAEAQVAQAQARVNGIYSQIADGTITAPFDGTIGSIDIEQGENASFGQSVITLVGEGVYEMILNVPEIDIAKVLLGDTVDITLDAYTDITWQGEVTAINASETFVDGVPVYETTITLADSDERVRSGMNGQATIVTGESLGAIAIPFRALERTGRDTYKVRVQRAGDDIETIEVTPGLRGNDSFVEIIDGLSLDDVIVLDKVAEEN